MTTQSTIVRTDPLDQAIQTVIQDIRIPKNLRAALADYQRKRADLNNHGISVVAPKPKSPSSFHLADGCQPDNSGSNEGNSIPNGVCADLAQKIDIQMWIDVESLDWCAEINGYRHKHIALEILEALIECAVIEAAGSVMRTFSVRPQ